MIEKYLSELPEGAVFDCDGTLADTMPLHYEAWCEAVEAHGLHFPEPKFYFLGGTPTQKIVEILSEEQGVPVDVAAVVHEKEEFFLKLLHKVVIIEPTVAFARELVSRGVAVSVASGGMQHVVRQTLECINLAELFPIVVTPEQVAHGKPAPDSFLLAAKKMGSSPEKTVVFEDSDTGETAARAAEMMLIRVESEGPMDKRHHRLIRCF